MSDSIQAADKTFSRAAGADSQDHHVIGVYSDLLYGGISDLLLELILIHPRGLPIARSAEGTVPALEIPASLPTYPLHQLSASLVGSGVPKKHLAIGGVILHCLILHSIIRNPWGCL